MTQTAVAQIDPDADPFAERYLGRTKPQKQKEHEIRTAERAHLIAYFQRLGDGRQSRSIPKEKRAVYREVAAIIAQNRDV